MKLYGSTTHVPCVKGCIQQEAPAVLLTLRENTGGNLDQASAVSALVLPALTSQVTSLPPREG